MKNHEVITFKVDKSLSKFLKGISNRSEFIRTAILQALNNLCPFCKGTGVLTAHHREHWEEFSKNHSLQECGDCREVKVKCHA